MTLSPAQIAGVAHTSGRWDGNDLTTAVAVALAESGGNPTATNNNTNGSTDYGLWQINSIHDTILARGNWSDPASNAAMARQIFDDAGGHWTPWSSYNNQRYRLFMGQAVAATQNPDYTAPTDGSAGTTATGAGYTASGASWWTNPLTALPRKLWDLLGGTQWAQRLGMILLGAFLLLLALLKTRQGSAVVGKVKSVGVRTAEAAVAA